MEVGTPNANLNRHSEAPDADSARNVKANDNIAPQLTQETKDASVQFEDTAVSKDAPLFIVLNSGSGKHSGEDVRHTIELTLSTAGRTFSLFEVGDPSRLKATAEKVVQSAREQGGIVVAAGGDGTINSVASATIGSGCPFGVIPLGTFNYFSRAHGIPSDVAAACQLLLVSPVIAVQVGMVNDRVFLVNASIGLYPALLEEREQAKRRFGRSRWVAFGAALATVLRFRRRLHIEFEIHQCRTQMVTPTLFVGNNHLQLTRVGIPAREVEHGFRLMAVLLRPVSVWGMLALVLRALLGRLGEAPEVISFGLERLVVRSRFGRRRFQVATDGEVLHMKQPLTFRIAPHPLLLVRPSDAGEDPG
ncbi:MAG TPA: diacylglycerol kinase family protein [Polyangiaceae bacterium]|nr:diacylglycerol kinase family protein [Polyangiaceae bacterium]